MIYKFKGKTRNVLIDLDKLDGISYYPEEKHIIFFINGSEVSIQYDDKAEAARAYNSIVEELITEKGVLPMLY